MPENIYNISFVGLDEKVFKTLDQSKNFNIIYVNLIQSFLTEVSFNPIDYIFKSIYTLRYKNRFRFFENLLRGLYRFCFKFSSPFYRKYSSYLLNISKGKVSILDFENTCETSNLLRQHTDLTVISNWWLMPDEIIYAPRFKTVNIHPSTLPKYRGSVPTLWALKNQDQETAVTFMVLDSRMDGGQIISQHTVSINENDDSITLENKCDSIIQENLVGDLLFYMNGNITPVYQDEAKTSKTAKYYDYMLINSKDETSKDIFNKVHLYPHLWPIDFCYLIHKKRNIKVKKVQKFLSEVPKSIETLKEPGDYLVNAKYLYIKTRDSFVSCHLFKDLSFMDSLYLYQNRQGTFNN